MPKPKPYRAQHCHDGKRKETESFNIFNDWFAETDGDDISGDWVDSLQLVLEYFCSFPIRISLKLTVKKTKEKENQIKCIRETNKIRRERERKKKPKG